MWFSMTLTRCGLSSLNGQLLLVVVLLFAGKQFTPCTWKKINTNQE